MIKTIKVSTTQLEVLFKLIKLGLLLPLTAAGYLGVISFADGFSRVFMIATFGPFLLAVAGDEWIGFLRAVKNSKRHSVN